MLIFSVFLYFIKGKKFKKTKKGVSFLVRIAICEDELEQVTTLSKYIKSLKGRYSDITRDVFRSGDDLLEHYKRATIDERYDIIYLDINMAGTNGVDTASIIRELDKKVLFIYVTNLQEYVFKASDTFMFRYLLKPVSWKKFYGVFVDAYKTLNVRRKTFNYTKEYTETRLYTDDILYFERLGRKIQIHKTDGTTDSIWHQIPLLYKELSPYGFIVPHKSFLVNMAHIHKITRKSLTLRDNTTEIPISNSHVQDVKEAFMDYEFKRVNV